MLIGTMRLLSKAFRVHLLKGLLDTEHYFKQKGNTILQKQSQVYQGLKSEVEPPLVVILRATDIVKKNLSDLNTQLKDTEARSPEEEKVNSDRKKELQREIWQLKALLRNLNLLILDVFKEFDQVIEKMLAPPSGTGAGKESVA